MEPSAFRPRLWSQPAAMATKPLLGAGTLHWPYGVVSPGHDRAVGLQAQAVVELPAAMATKPLLGAGTLHWP